MDAIRELRTRAEILHRRIQSGDHKALGRLRILPRFRKASYEELGAGIRRMDCLAVIAAELGFENWPQAKRALEGQRHIDEFGTLLCSPCGTGHLNLWFRDYDEAVRVRESCEGYLLAHRRHFFVADRHYVESIGLDPDHPDWDAMGFDWVRPKAIEARSRLYARLVAALPREA